MLLSVRPFRRALTYSSPRRGAHTLQLQQPRHLGHSKYASASNCISGYLMYGGCQSLFMHRCLAMNTPRVDAFAAIREHACPITGSGTLAPHFRMPGPIAALVTVRMFIVVCCTTAFTRPYARLALHPRYARGYMCRFNIATV